MEELINKNRLLILKNLFDCKNEMCGCDLIDKLRIKKNLLSYHIKCLEKIGYIVETRCGQKKKYKINEKKREIIKKIFEVIKLIEESK